MELINGPWGDADGAIDLTDGTSCVVLQQDGGLPEEWSISLLVSLEDLSEWEVGDDDIVYPLPGTGPALIGFDAEGPLGAQVSLCFQSWVQSGTPGESGSLTLCINNIDSPSAPFGAPTGLYVFSKEDVDTPPGSVGDSRRWMVVTLVRRKVTATTYTFDVHVDDWTLDINGSTTLTGTQSENLGEGGISLGGNVDGSSYITGRIAATWVFGRALTAAEHLAAFTDLRDNGNTCSVLPPEE